MNQHQQVCQQIMFSDFTNEQLNGIIQAVQFARNNIAKSNISSIRPGISVEFKSSKTGRNITGEVTKVGRKFVYIREHGYSFGNWKVPANMLTLMPE